MRLFSQNVKVERLRGVPLFEGLSKKELTELARLTDDLALAEGTVLCREGNVGREFFVLVDGVVEVTKGGKLIATRQGGDFIGEIALLTDLKRTATVRARTPLRCFALTAGAFRQVLDDNPSVARKVTQALAERLHAVSEDPTA